MPLRFRQLVTVLLLLSASLFLPQRGTAQTYTYSVVYASCTSDSCIAMPYDVVQAMDGNFYGPNAGDGFDFGGIVQITPAGSASDIIGFCAVGSQTCPQGIEPGALVLGGDGSLYGGTLADQFNNGQNVVTVSGTAFKASLSGTLDTYYTFPCSETACDFVSSPGLVPGSGGNFYGVSYNYGGGPGAVIEISSSGSVSTLYTFCSEGGTACTDGENPTALLQGSDGNLYGTAGGGGANGYGTVFKLTSNGVLTTLYSFCSVGGSKCTDGIDPAALIEGKDGNFYGVTEVGGKNATSMFYNGTGTVFKITPSGSFTKIHDFCGQGGSNCTDGAVTAELIAGSNGNFYGTAVGGGENAQGVLYKVTPSGSYSVAYNFCSTGGAACTDGAGPAGLALGNDGGIYGIAFLDGPNNSGAFYKLTASPALPAAVQATVSASQITLGETVTLSFQALNAFSLSMQQCYAFQMANGTMTALGATGSVGENNVFSGSLQLLPQVAGTYTFSVDCGGIEASAPVVVAVVPSTKYTSTTTFSSNDPNAGYGDTVTLSATVGGQTGVVASGTVKFMYGSMILATKALVNGTASYSASTLGLPLGTYNLTAEYSGDLDYNPSSGMTSVALGKAQAYVTASASPNPVTPPAECTLTATVVRLGSGIPKGTVTFSYGSLILGTVSINASGVATLNASSKGIPANYYQLTATYNGDADDTSTSNGFSVTVQ